MTGDKEEKYNVKIVSRSLAIFDMAAEREDPFTVQDVMNALQVNVNMAYRLLSTMTAAGYLIKNEATGTYTVSLKVLKLFNRALSSVHIRKFAVLYDGEIVQTDRIDGKVMIKTYFTPGRKIPCNASALGKVLVCELYPEELERIIDKNGGLKEFTVHTITDYAVLQRELKKVREQGYATDREELILNDNCNAAPIRDSSGNIVAAVSMSAFDNYIAKERMDANIYMICETARQISSCLGYMI